MERIGRIIADLLAQLAGPRLQPAPVPVRSRARRRRSP